MSINIGEVLPDGIENYPPVAGAIAIALVGGVAVAGLHRKYNQAETELVYPNPEQQASAVRSLRTEKAVALAGAILAFTASFSSMNEETWGSLSVSVMVQSIS